MSRILIPLIFGLAGAAVLISLGVWQAQRMVWKEAVLADIEARIAAPAAALPADPDPEADRYLPVKASGVLEGPELHVLVSTKELGAGYRVIRAFETGGRRVLVDLGYIPLTAKDDARAAQPLAVTGNLHWPEEVDAYTPAPDQERAIWFARDVPAMARALNTEPVLIIARTTTPDATGVTPLPLDSVNIPNDHLEYVITWFSLALIWLAMTGYLIRRNMRAQKDAAKGKVT